MMRAFVVLEVDCSPVRPVEGRRLYQTDHEIRARDQSVVHSRAMHKRIRPQLPAFKGFSKIQHRQCMIWAVAEVRVTQIVDVSQQIVEILLGVWSELVHPLHERNQSISKPMADDGLLKHPGEEVPSRQMILESFLAVQMSRGGDVKLILPG